jgi:AcrR family transcriptional regulator
MTTRIAGIHRAEADPVQLKMKLPANTENRSRRKILQAATDLFLSRGFLATTTRAIAERAKVNEALIFYYFKGKQNLRWTVLQEMRESTHVIETIQARLQSRQPEKLLFAGLAEDILRMVEHDHNLLRLLLAPGLEDGDPSRSIIARFYRQHLMQSYGTLAKYIRRRIREGAYRRVDPWLASRAFFSLVAYHVIIQEFFGGKHTHSFSRKRVAKTVSLLWLEGIRKRHR